MLNAKLNKKRRMFMLIFVIVIQCRNYVAPYDLSEDENRMTRRWDGTDNFPPVNRNVSNVQRIHLLEADLAEIQQDKEKLLGEAANLRGYIDMKRVGVQLDWKGRNVVELDYRQVYVEALKKIEQQLKQYQSDSHDCVCRSSDGRVPDTKLKGKDLMFSDLIKKYISLERKTKDLTSRLPEITSNRNLYTEAAQSKSLLKQQLAECRGKIAEYREKLTLMETKLPGVLTYSARTNERERELLQHKIGVLEKELIEVRRDRKEMEEFLRRKNSELRDISDTTHLLHRQIYIAKATAKLNQSEADRMSPRAEDAPDL